MYEYNLGIKFEDIVKQYPDNTAIKFPDSLSISYSKLNNKANQFARYLLKNGINKYDVVCIAGIKNVNTYICMLACLKIGAVYSIFDDKIPNQRLERIISRCLPKLLFLIIY